MSTAKIIAEEPLAVEASPEALSKFMQLWITTMRVLAEKVITLQIARERAADVRIKRQNERLSGIVDEQRKEVARHAIRLAEEAVANLAAARDRLNNAEILAALDFHAAEFMSPAEVVQIALDEAAMSMLRAQTAANELRDELSEEDNVVRLDGRPSSKREEYERARRRVAFWADTYSLVEQRAKATPTAAENQAEIRAASLAIDAAYEAMTATRAVRDAALVNRKSEKAKEESAEKEVPLAAAA